MQANKLKWCFEKATGLAIIEPSQYLCYEYLKRSDESLVALAELTTSKNWKIITAYYAAYNALYALFMKCGIKSEIHDCTIEAMKVFIELDVLTNEEYSMMQELKDLRISRQYYITTVPLKEERVAETEKKAKRLIVKFKEAINTLPNVKIEQIRKKFIEIKRAF